MTRIDPPASEEIHAWIDAAYRRPEGVPQMSNDGYRFTRWNMEVAFMAGWNAARAAIERATGGQS